jgi:hypothetical protein
MARTRPGQRRRQRVLSDDELKAVWWAAEGSPSAFGYLVHFPAADGNEAYGSGCYAP